MDIQRLIQRLELIPDDLVVCLEEGEFLPIGELCADALKYIKMLESECSTPSSS
jgi:hypothetical protein